MLETCGEAERHRVLEFRSNGESAIRLLGPATCDSGIQLHPTGVRMTVKPSRLSYAETISTLEQRITDGGSTIFASIDQAAAAASVQMTLRPTTLLVFGNPKGGTPLMEAFPLFALELPLKLLIWEESGKVCVGYTPLAQIATRYEVTGMDERISVIDRQLDAITNSVI